MVDYNWNTNDPVDETTIGSIPEEIRDVKDQVASRLDIEHVAVASGTDDTDSGGIHKKGSARVFYQSGEPVYSPDSESDDGEGTTVLLTDTDVNSNVIGTGRLWVDTDTNSLYVYTGSSWATVSIAGGLGARDFILTAGLSGGQTLVGGTDANDDLNLQASAVSSTTAQINFLKNTDKTNAIEMNDIPVKSLLLGENASGGSTTGSDGYQIKGVKTASDIYDVLTKGVASIIAADVSATGGIPRMAFGHAAGSATTKTVTLSFEPDFVIGWNNVSGDLYMWSIQDTTKCYNLSSGSIASSPNMRISASAAVITFTGALSGLNTVTGTPTFFYIAFKWNIAEENPTT